ncbi:MAG TPA: hypothetical protein VFZ00_05040 [Solirubrobacter sp.]|nr:hypothetical protein [Solirubrobacter sp.]
MQRFDHIRKDYRVERPVFFVRVADREFVAVCGLVDTPVFFVRVAVRDRVAVRVLVDTPVFFVRVAVRDWVAVRVFVDTPVFPVLVAVRDRVFVRVSSSVSSWSSSPLSSSSCAKATFGPPMPRMSALSHAMGIATASSSASVTAVSRRDTGLSSSSPASS